MPWQWKVLNRTLISVTRLHIVLRVRVFNLRLNGLSAARGADGGCALAVRPVSTGGRQTAPAGSRVRLRNALLFDIIKLLSSTHMTGWSTHPWWPRAESRIYSMLRKRTINKLRRLLHVLLFLPAVIGIVMAVRRTLVLAGVLGSFNPPGMSRNSPPFDAEFGRHPLLTLIH